MEVFGEWLWLKNAGRKRPNLGGYSHTSTPRPVSQSLGLVYSAMSQIELNGWSCRISAVTLFFSNFNDSIRSASWWAAPPSFRLRCRRLWSAAAALSWGWPLRVGSCWPRMDSKWRYLRYLYLRWLLMIICACAKTRTGMVYRVYMIYDVLFRGCFNVYLKRSLFTSLNGII